MWAKSGRGGHTKHEWYIGEELLCLISYMVGKVSLACHTGVVQEMIYGREYDGRWAALCLFRWNSGHEMVYGLRPPMKLKGNLRGSVSTIKLVL